VPESFVRVAYPIPLEETFWYRNSGPARVEIGVRVEAPLRKRPKATGYVVEVVEAFSENQPASSVPQDLPQDLARLDPDKIRDILRVVDTEPLFDPETLALGRWLAAMYHCSLGEALSAMLPSARRERQEVAEEFDEVELSRTPLVLTSGQKAALDGILSEPEGMFYLYGPTGTGKTEVFLQLAEATLAQGRGVLYLVPEIALTRQVEQDVRARFGARCAIIHSRLTPSHKLAEWRRIAKSEARIVVGARSAVFAPISDLGLIIIDEEHDSGYKSGTTPRYHARQVAMHRARLAQARIVMGSATPSPEAWQACGEGHMRRFSLTDRPAGGSFPDIRIIDMRGRQSLISEELAQALRDAKSAGRQSILFLNRRGFARTLICQTCGAEVLCRHCSVPLTYHKASGRLVCHYCGYSEPKPEACPDCGSLDLVWASYGTERIEEELDEHFPGMSHARLDTDTASAKGALEDTLRAFRDGEIDLLVGTQMVAKGLNFPGVRVVGILMADQGLSMPDFRAAERVFSLIVQVAGRAGRHRPDGLVFVQTRKPESPVIRLAAAGDVSVFLERELEARRQLEFPPAARLCRVVFRSRSSRCARDEASKCAAAARLIVQNPAFADIAVLGPSECPLAIVADNHRYQLIFRARRFSDLQRFVKVFRHSIDPVSSVYLEIDIDPVQMM
jgi:primosomal protein N' (replication factor Y)